MVWFIKTSTSALTPVDLETSPEISSEWGPETRAGLENLSLLAWYLLYKHLELGALSKRKERKNTRSTDQVRCKPLARNGPVPIATAP